MAEAPVREKIADAVAALVGDGVVGGLERAELGREAACFFQDLDDAGPQLEAGVLLGLLDERLAAGRPTFLNASQDRLPPGLTAALRARLPTLEPPGSRGA